MSIIIREFGLRPYEPMWHAMQHFTQTRTGDTPDEIWILEHLPVYTLGLNGKREHLLNPGGIPVIQCDRGGQVTYHGPGQLIIYPLLDIKRLKLNIRQLVTLLEQAMITALNQFGLTAVAKPEAPGVYINEKKIGSIGIRIKNNSCYHGLSFNNNMDLMPFDHINPCGFRDLKMTQLAEYGISIDTRDLALPVLQAITAAISHE